MVVCTIALGAVWMVLTPAPIAKTTGDKPAKRALAYEQAIAEARKDEASAEGNSGKADDEKTAEIPPFDTVTTAPQPGAAVSDSSSDNPGAVQDLTSDSEDSAPQDAAALPNEESQGGAQPTQDMAALPDQQAAPYDGVPPLPRENGAASDQYGTDGAEQWDDERGAPQAYGQPPQYDAYGRPLQRQPSGEAYGQPGQSDPYGQNPPYGQDGPYGQGDPYGAQQADQGNAQGASEYDQNAEQLVEVMVSGSPMRATASEDAPMLFAFPYGRTLKVVSRYEGWVEVTDPKSGATGWMEAGVLAPARANRDPYGQNEAYYDDRSTGRGPGGWIRRGADEFSNMLNRAFGGGGGY